MLRRSEELEAEAKRLKKRAWKIIQRTKSIETTERMERRKEQFATRNKVITWMYEDGSYSYAELGRRFGLSPERIRQIYLSTVWKRRREQTREVEREIHMRLGELERMREPLKRFLAADRPGEERE